MLPDPGDVPPIADVLRVRRGALKLSQADVADAVARLDRPTITSDEYRRWERGKRIPRAGARRALESVLDLPALLLDRAATVQREARRVEAVGIGADPVADGRGAVDEIRSVLVDAAARSWSGSYDLPPPELADVEEELEQVMASYQSSSFGHMLGGLPQLLSGAHNCVLAGGSSERRRANRALALSNHAVAMVLTKVGELDLAWMASERGRAAAEASEDVAVIGSLERSLVHALQSHGRTEASSRLAERSADALRGSLGTDSDVAGSVYGTFLLASAMAAARAGDTAGATSYLDEADHHARKLGGDANHLWTAFGPTNVKVHRVATAVASDDIAAAERHATDIDPSGLPKERRVRYLLDLAMVAVHRDDVDRALEVMLDAERISPEHVLHHRMAQQIVGHLRATKRGKQDPRLAQLDQRTRRVQQAGARGQRGPRS